MQSVKPWIGEIVDNGLRVLIYSGQLDIIVATPLTASFLRSLVWQHQAEFAVSPREHFQAPFDKEITGFVRNVQNLYHVIVRNGGHMLPYDQPKRSKYVIQQFIVCIKPKIGH
ncbi:hypothetical protein SNEBB_006559 [Seison nebaliae]|nr:hypothetical protein SNEBB_006559 [Seison nebaliae]